MSRALLMRTVIETDCAGHACTVYTLHSDASYPDDVAANLHHVIRLSDKIRMLQDQLRESLDALAQSVNRWPEAQGNMTQLVNDLREADVPGRSTVVQRAGIKELGTRRFGTCDFAVYVLKRAGTAIYVGSSQSWRKRIKHHNSDKVFDEVEVYECRTRADMLDLEAVLQQQHAPSMNVRIERRRPA